MIVEFYRAVDLWIESAIARRVARAGSLDIEQYFKDRGIPESDQLNQMLGNLREIYDNTASLLTHISTMIAALGLMLLFSEKNTLFQVIVQIEIVLYTSAAALCVYILRRYALTRVKKQNYIDDLYQKYMQRRYLYVVCTDAVLIFTLLFLLMVVSHVVFGS